MTLYVSKNAKKRLGVIKKNHPGKQINRMISCRKSCPLTFTQRHVLSTLIFRCRREGKNICVKPLKLAELCQMKFETVKKALDVLASHNLVWQHAKGRGRYGTNPIRWPNDVRPWFGWIATQAIGFTPYLVPAKPITTTDALIWSQDHFGDKEAQALLAVWFNLDRRTIRRSRKKLAELTYSEDWWQDVKTYE